MVNFLDNIWYVVFFFPWIVTKLAGFQCLDLLGDLGQRKEIQCVWATRSSGLCKHTLTTLQKEGLGNRWGGRYCTPRMEVHLIRML